MKIKKRVSKKKDVAESEEIRSIVSHIFATTGQGIEKYRLIVIACFTVLVILSIVAATYYYLYQKWNNEAAILENNAYNYYLEGNYKEALAKYQEIVKDYSATRNTPIAMYYIGNSYLELGQNDEAIQAYQKAAEKNSDKETILPLAYVNLGRAYLNKKDYSSAISAFKQAAALKDSPVADRVAYETARAYEISGDKASAIERYDYLIKTFPNSPWSQDASAKLNKAKGGTGTPLQEPQQNKADTKGTNNQ